MATLARNVIARNPATGDVSGGGQDGIHGGEGSGDGHGGGGGGEAWVTVATFSVSAAAHLARLKLEGEEIPCVIVDEHVIATTWVLSPALGGIKLQVPPEWLGLAREVLGEDGPLPQDGWQVEAEAAARCQTCGQGEYAVGKPPIWAVLLSILALGIPLLFLPRPLRCDRCGASPK